LGRSSGVIYHLTILVRRILVFENLGLVEFAFLLDRLSSRRFLDFVEFSDVCNPVVSCELRTCYLSSRCHKRNVLLVNILFVSSISTSADMAHS
jgi:hypothetical protein